MKLLFYVATFLGGIFGTLIVFSTFLADSAPQQGAGAAVAVALVVIPYCMARVIGESQKDRLLEALAKAVVPPAPPTQAPARPAISPPPNSRVPAR
jgi:hypothetical protein